MSPDFRRDAISDILKADDLIMTYAKHRVKGLEDDPISDEEGEDDMDFDTNKEEKLTRIRQRLRELGKYLKIFREVTGNETMTLEDTFDDKNVEFLKQVVNVYSKKFTTPHALDSLRRSISKYEYNH